MSFSISSFWHGIYGRPVLIFFRFASLLSIIFLSLPVLAEESYKDNFGLGVGLAAGAYPHYPGADESDTLVIPFPYFEYHGERFKVDTDGMVANLFNSERVNLDFSVNASLPVSDDDNTAREGMDDLELVLEIGPQLEIMLAKRDESELRLDLPVRPAFEFTLEDAPRHVGFTFDPRIHYERQFGQWDVDFDIGALFATSRYHALYYEVDQEFVTPDRAAFEAESGLTAWRFSSSAERRLGDWIFNFYLRYMNLSGAANDDSPLLVDDNYLAGGVAVIWMFKHPQTQK